MSRELSEGEVFARDYRIVRPLAEGGMGRVYVAEQISTGRQRALKVMLPRLAADAPSVARFVQEARVASRIESEHVVEVIGAGVDEETRMPWLAMELLQGETLAEAVERRGPLPRPDALEVMEQLCHALGAAHRAGLVHRDLKPENVFLARARRPGVAFTLKVLDFGIAKFLQEAKTAATATGAMGTPLWMAPEQAEARGKIGPATDVWALGLIAYFAITGRCYWRVASVPEASIGALLKEIVIDPIEPATTRAAEAGLALPEGFDAWFARCVHRDATARWRDAGSVMDQLRSVLAAPDAVPAATRTPVHATGPAAAPSLPVASAGPAVTPARSTSPADASTGAPRWAIAALVATALAVGAIVAIALAGGNRPARAPEIATPVRVGLAIDSGPPGAGPAPTGSPDQRALATSTPAPRLDAPARGRPRAGRAHAAESEPREPAPREPPDRPVEPAGQYTDRELAQVFWRARADLQQCVAGHAGRLSATLRIDPDGTVAAADVSGIAGEPRDCAVAQLRALRFPPFSGAPRRVRRSFELH